MSQSSTETIIVNFKTSATFLNFFYYKKIYCSKAQSMQYLKGGSGSGEDFRGLWPIEVITSEFQGFLCDRIIVYRGRFLWERMLHCFFKIAFSNLEIEKCVCISKWPECNLFAPSLCLQPALCLTEFSLESTSKYERGQSLFILIAAFSCFFLFCGITIWHCTYLSHFRL